MTFTWRRTFPDTHCDFSADVPEGHVGRVMQQTLHGLGREAWFWTAAGLYPTAGQIGPVSGEAYTKDAATEALTDAYHRAREWGARTGKPFIRPPPPERRPIVDEFV